jgi:hypothetical protein
MHDSALRAASVASQVSAAQAVVAVAAGLGSPRRSSEQPHAPAVGASASAEQRVELGADRRLNSSSASDSRRSCGAACTTSAGRRPSRRRPAGRRGRRGRSPGSSPRCSSAGRGGRRSARRACRCPCRRRWWRPSRARPRAGSGPGARRARRRPAGVVRQRGDALRDSQAAVSSTLRATGSRRCRPRPDARREEAQQLRARARPSRRWCSGCSAGRSWRRRHARLAQLQPLDDLGARRRVGGGGERDARHAGEALVQHGAGGTPGGSRGPTARRSAPRRWRTARARARASSIARKRGVSSRSGAT